MPLPEIVSPDEWRSARIALLDEEKALTRARDALSAKRRQLPMVRVEADYRFHGPSGEKVTLLDLFDGHDQLIVGHFMFDPEWTDGCPSCTAGAEEMSDGQRDHLATRDTRLVYVSRAPIEKIEAYRTKKGWTFPWYSSFGSSFNYDFHVTIDGAVAPAEYNYRSQDEWAQRDPAWAGWSGEQPGTSCFLRVDDAVFHTYSSFGRAPSGPVGPTPSSTSPPSVVRRTGSSPPAGARRSAETAPTSPPERATMGGVTEVSADDAWAEHVPAFVDGHYGSLRGRVRTYVVDAHLRHHLTPPPGRIVDVGGGAGTQSIPLARAGYDVTIVDPSPAMLARAQAAADGEDAGTRSRVHLVEAPGEAAPAAVGGAVFDGVLCHGVLMYLDDPRPLVASLCALAAPGGLVSIVAKNVEVMAVLPAHRGDWAAALAAFDEDRQVNGLGLPTRGDSREALERTLAGHGVDPLAWYGVRLFTDGWTPDRPVTDPEDVVLAVELEASRRDPYRTMSRLFHLLGRRR